jgi:hypothetical protein
LMLAVVVAVVVRRKARARAMLRQKSEAHARLSMHKFQDHLVPFNDIAFGERIGTGAAGTVYRAKLRRHTDVAVKSVAIPVRARACACVRVCVCVRALRMRAQVDERRSLCG